MMITMTNIRTATPSFLGMSADLGAASAVDRSFCAIAERALVGITAWSPPDR